MKKILLLGKDGQLGWELQRTLSPIAHVVALGRTDVDLTDGDAIKRVVKGTKAQIVVNAMAYTAVDKAESEKEVAYACNAKAPELMAKICQETGAFLLHYSTDYVFDGQKKTPYEESDAVKPRSVYGASKLAGEEGIRQSGANHLIMRICWVYGMRRHNFLKTILRLAGEREDLGIVSDQVGSPTWCRTIAQVSAHVVAARLAGGYDGYAQTLHMSAAEECSWYDFSRAIVDVYPGEDKEEWALKSSARIKAITTDAYPLPAPRPAYSKLSSALLEKEYGLMIPSWQSQLEMCLGR
ncbi:MAG: dTDP-4-dehydrorhamnose reductase [Planctomycetes bacterium]|nr:dTDP-4-dehydrorhamnose reductase [Planctomycetota bacterium]